MTVKRIVFFGVALIALLCSSASALAGETVEPLKLGFIKPAGGNASMPEGWEPLTFGGVDRHTEYKLVEVDSGAAVEAVADKSASAIIYKLSDEAGRRPILRWRWKIEGVHEKGNATQKSGDDFAARVYVAFVYDPKSASFGERVKFNLAKAFRGEYPPGSSLNYIWANKLPKGQAIDNAYTERNKMIALRSGNGEAGQWLEERVDIVSDYKKLFGKAPPKLSGIAIMSDSDDTAGLARAWYADVVISAK